MLFETVRLGVGALYELLRAAVPDPVRERSLEADFELVEETVIDFWSEAVADIERSLLTDGRVVLLLLLTVMVADFVIDLGLVRVAVGMGGVVRREFDSDGSAVPVPVFECSLEAVFELLCDRRVLEPVPSVVKERDGLVNDFVPDCS